MEVRVFYRMTLQNPGYSTDLMEWVGELSDEEYSAYQKAKTERNEDYNDVYEELPDDFDLEDTSLEDIENEESIQEFIELNYEILEEVLPDWCEDAKNSIIEEQEEVGEENENVCVENLEIDGCLVEEADAEELVENKDSKVPLVLHYYVEFGRMDCSDTLDWDAELTYDQYQTYYAHVKIHPQKSNSFETLEELFPEWAKREYDSIVRVETNTFKENENPEDWNLEDEFNDPDWKITDTYSLDICGMDILK